MKKGLVIKSTGSRYTVKLEDGQIIYCLLKGVFRKKGSRNTNPIAVGDRVSVLMDDSHELATISAIEERKNYIIRKATNLSKSTHIIAANVDQAILIVTITKPKTTTLFIDRFLMSAEAYRIPVVLVFNKIDLYNKRHISELEELIGIYEHVGYLCYKTSVSLNSNLEIVKEILKDKISVISGNSGVGKSSIINAIDNNLNLRTNLISDYHLSGKHTTAFAEMFSLSFGGSIIDTPGIKGFGLVDVNKEEMYHFFPEIFKIADNCEFYNCMHMHEPNCAVRNAVDQGKISASRYNNYVSIYLNINSKYR